MGDVLPDAPLHGSCLCGAVAFEAVPPLRDVVACHCNSCRKQSGHFWATSTVPDERFRLLKDEGLAWIATSPKAQRGFCKDCGSFLFWKPSDEARISFSMGAIDGPTGLVTVAHLLPEEAGDYYSPEGPPPSPAAEVPERLHGSCLCGANRFSLPAPSGGVGACHCSQCRKFSGHYTASFDADEATLDWQAQSTREFTLPRGGRQGFCTDCGCRLYFRSASGGFSIEAGSIDGPTGLRLESHIFVADKGDYYQLDDGLPQYAAWD